MNLFLLNPQSQNAGALKNRIKKYISDLKIQGEFIEVKKVEDLSEIVKKAVEEKADAVVAIGGDGMINRIVPLLVKSDTALGVVPIGETNFFAKTIGIKNWKDGCRNLVQGKIVEIGLGTVNSRYFVSSVEIDPKAKDGEVKKNFWFKRKQEETPVPVSMSVQSENSSLKFSAECYSILVSTVPISINDNEQGADNDQLLNIIIKSRNKKNHETRKTITILQGQSIGLQSKAPMNIKADGEEIGKTPAVIEKTNHKLRLLKPQPRRGNALKNPR